MVANRGDEEGRNAFRNANIGISRAVADGLHLSPERDGQAVALFASHDQVARYKAFHFEEHTNDAAKDVFACIGHLPFTPSARRSPGQPSCCGLSKGIGGVGLAFTGHGSRTPLGVQGLPIRGCRREPFFQFTMFELPEGTINYRFQGHSALGQGGQRSTGSTRCKSVAGRWAVTTMVIRITPPDPRLGTWKELEEGLRACRKMGLKVYFFVNYQPVMVESDKFEEFAQVSRMGEPRRWCHLEYRVGPMGTLLGGRSNTGNGWFGPSPRSRSIGRLFVNQFAKAGTDWAPTASTLDKMFPAVLDYNPDLPLSPDIATWEGAITLTKEVLVACRKYQSELGDVVRMQLGPDDAVHLHRYWSMPLLAMLSVLCHLRLMLLQFLM